MLGPATIEERFKGEQLDEAVWTPAYLPAWSSAREAAATYEVIGEGLRLTIPPEQPLWCPDLHDEPLRVSAVQSGTWSGLFPNSRMRQCCRKASSPQGRTPTFEGRCTHNRRCLARARLALSIRLPPGA